MTSDDDARIWEMYNNGEGLSIRAVAQRLGINRGKVARALDRIAAVAAADWDEGDEGDEAVFFDASEDYQAQPPFRFVGIATELVQLPGDDYARPQVTERFLDGNGRSVSKLDIYRADYADESGVDKGYLADALAQIEAAGYRQVNDPATGRWHWKRGSEPRSATNGRRPV